MAKAKKTASKKASKKAASKKGVARTTAEPVVVSGLAEAVPDAALPVADRTRFVPKAKTGTAVEPVVEVAPKANRNREFLIGVFAEPTSIPAAGMKLAALYTDDSQMTLAEADKAVEVFLDKAANDPDLDIRRKMDGSEWVYLIKALPAGVQLSATAGRRRTVAKKNGKTKTAVTTKVAKPVAKAAKSASGEKRPGVIATMLRLVVEKARTKNEVLDGLVKAFPDRTREAMAKTFGVAIGGSKPSVAAKGATVSVAKRDGAIYYKAVLAKT